MRLSSDVIGLIELVEPIACERLLEGERAALRWRRPQPEATPVTIVSCDLSQLAAELHCEWLELMAGLATVPRAAVRD